MELAKGGRRWRKNKGYELKRCLVALFPCFFQRILFSDFWEANKSTCTISISSRLEMISSIELMLNYFFYHKLI